MWRVFWCFGIVLIGAIPIIARILACALSNSITLESLNATDITLLGLTANWTNINESISLFTNNKKQKLLNNTATLLLLLTSISLVVILALLLGFLYFSEINECNNKSINGNAIYLAIPLTILSLILSYFYIKKLKV